MPTSHLQFIEPTSRGAQFRTALLYFLPVSPETQRIIVLVDRTRRVSYPPDVELAGVPGNHSDLLESVAMPCN